MCVPSDWERMNDLVDAMNKMQVTTAFSTLSVSSTLQFESLMTLDTIILGGESLPPALVSQWATKFRLIMAYGDAGGLCRAITGRAWIVEPDDFNV